MNENTKDRRVRKTRQQLRQGLVQLMREKSIQDITVTELCAVCDINRSTFYLHYPDVYQLLKSIEDELLVKFEEAFEDLIYLPVPSQTHPSPAMCRMFELLYDNADMCRVLLCDNGDMAFLQKVKDMVRLRVLDGWGARLHTQAAYDYVNAFIVSGCIGMLQCWLEKDMPIGPAAMAAMVEAVMIKGIGALETKETINS